MRYVISVHLEMCSEVMSDRLQLVNNCHLYPHYMYNKKFNCYSTTGIVKGSKIEHVCGCLLVEVGHIYHRLVNEQNINYCRYM